MSPKRRAVNMPACWTLLALLGGLWLAACTPATPTPIVISEAQATQTAQPPVATPLPAQPEARLQLGAAAIAGLNPLAIPDPATEAVQSLIYETLVGYDAARELQPVLAASLPTSSADGLTWTIDIQPDVSLHDGMLLDGALVAAALQACLDTPAQDDTSLALAALRSLVAEITAQDLRVTIRLRMPFAQFPDLLAEQSLAISNGPGIGSGPFMVTSSDAPGLALDRFSSYHGGVPSLAGVDVRLYADEPDPSAALADALNAGTLDVAIGEGLGVPAAFQAWAALPTQAMLILDTRVAPFDQAAVRDALGQVATPGAAAREALASAGLPDAFDVQVWNTQDPAVAESLVAAEFAPLAANAALVSARTDDVIQALGAGLGLAADQTSVAADGTPTAFVVGGREDWQQAFWLALAQAVAADVLASGPLDSPAQVVVRDSVQGLAMTSGGWPRLTAGTILAAGEMP